MIWLTYFAKWIHLCLVLLLLGAVSASYSFTLRVVKSTDAHWRQQLIRLAGWSDAVSWLSIIVVAVTGTILVYPRGYTFQTPWINAAYVFLALSAICFYVIGSLKDKLIKSDSVSALTRWVYHVLNILIMVVLAVIAYEAVAKSTFL